MFTDYKDGGVVNKNAARLFGISPNELLQPGGHFVPSGAGWCEKSIKNVYDALAVDFDSRRRVFLEPAQPSAELLEMIELKILDRRRVSIKTRGSLRREIWDRKIISFRTMLSEMDHMISGTALALSDPRDALPPSPGR
jgi:hypothetical protein